MPDLPSYKGSLLSGVVDEIRKHLERGEITQADVEKFLRPEERELLEGIVVASQWYPLTTYAHMCELMFQVVGHGEVEYLLEQGRQSAIRLIDKLGLYTQLNYVNNTEIARTDDPEQRTEAFLRDLEVMAMGTAIQNFGAGKNERDPEHPRRIVSVMDVPLEYSETLVWRHQGFRNEMARRHGHDDIWTWERPTPSRLIWRMRRDP